MLGHVVATHLQELGHDVMAVCRTGTIGHRCRNLDLDDRVHLRGLLAEFRPDWVVNAAGRLNREVDMAPARAISVNSVLPHLLAEWGADLGYRVLHISTDCVFSGRRGAYRVDEIPDATTKYGQSKALGELVNARDLTIRTSIVGPELSASGTGLMLWFMRQNGSVPGWERAIWTGLTTLELARIVEAVVAGRIAVTGLWQCVPPGPISKADLLGLFNAVFRRTPLAITRVEGEASDKSLINNHPRLWSVPDYREMITQLHGWIDVHQAMYMGTPFVP